MNTTANTTETVTYDVRVVTSDLDVEWPMAARAHTLAEAMTSYDEIVARLVSEANGRGFTLVTLCTYPEGKCPTFTNTTKIDNKDGSLTRK